MERMSLNRCLRGGPIITHSHGKVPYKAVLLGVNVRPNLLVVSLS